MVQTTGVVLAGGLSRRLGRNKAKEVVGGATLLQRVVRALEPLCQRVVVVAGPANKLEHEGLGPEVRVVTDLLPGRGPLGGLHTALTVSDSRYNLVVGCDMPFVSAQVLRLLVELAPGRQAVVPRVGGIPQTLHAVYARDCLESIEGLLATGRPGLVGLLALVSVRYVEEDELRGLDPQLLTFFNVNTEDDLTRARAIAAGSPGNHPTQQ